MMIRSTRRISATIVVGLALLAGCASAPAPAEPVSTSHAEEASEGTQADPSESPTPPTGVAGLNALDITGPATAGTVPDMEPVISDAAPALPATITDVTGAEVEIASADRVLSLDLYGTLTDTIIGLGLADRLVGRSNSDTQDLLADLPVVTQGGHDLNIEAVLNLHPDLILTNVTIGSVAAYDQLQAAGVTVVRFEHLPSFAGISDIITAVGQTFGMAAAAGDLAAHVATELELVRAEIAALAANTPRPPRGVVLYVRGTAGIFFILGADYGAADVLEALGLADVAANAGIVDLKPANAESLISLDPEIVLAMAHGISSSGGVEGFLGRPGMSATTAGERERVVMAEDNQLLSYGPRTPANLRTLADAIYGPGGE